MGAFAPAVAAARVGLRAPGVPEGAPPGPGVFPCSDLRIIDFNKFPEGAVLLGLENFSWGDPFTFTITFDNAAVFLKQRHASVQSVATGGSKGDSLRRLESELGSMQIKAIAAAEADS
jgi:hypothetical protein